MDSLQNTVGEGDDMRPIMACHYSGEDAFACRGYIAREGWSNINVRLLAADGIIPIAAIVDACEGLDLYPDFHTMLSEYQEANKSDE